MNKLYPNLYLKKVEDITIQELIKNKIKLLILDVDNTLIDYYKNLSEDTINWIKEMKMKPENIGVVGDQIFTDILGGNRCKMFTILVEPRDNKKDYWYTSWKRPLENKIKKRFETKEEKNKNVH